ncbi:MAG: FHA domain-containing protein [Betaproteobacteria bacterium]
METLALIELLDRDGQPRQTLRVSQWPVRVGRAIDCDLVIDDPHVAAHHADLVWREGGVHIEPAATVNGVRLGRATVAAGSTPRLPSTGLVTLGITTLRVRLAGEVLAPEVKLADLHLGERRNIGALLALMIFAALWKALDLWVSSVPGESGSTLAGHYLGTPVALIVWCALWALGSKLFQHYFAFWPHLRLALFWLLVGLVAEAAAGQLAFALSMPWIAKLGRIVFVGAVAMLLWRHMSLVLPQRRQAFALAIASAVTVGGGLLLADRALLQQPLVGDLYLGTISLPAVRVAKPVSADAFVKSAQPLETALSRLAKPGGEGDDDDSADDD